MSTTRVRIDPDDPSTFPEGRIDPAVVDSTTEAEIALQDREDEAEALQDMARYTRRIRRRMGLSQTELARRRVMALRRAALAVPQASDA